jgi:hypothetical protein
VGAVLVAAYVYYLAFAAAVIAAAADIKMAS